jgi:hypothetical protein
MKMFINNKKFRKGDKMLARGRSSKKFNFANFFFKGSMGNYQNDWTSRKVYIKNQKTMHPTGHVLVKDYHPLACSIPRRIYRAVPLINIIYIIQMGIITLGRKKERTIYQVG